MPGNADAGAPIDYDRLLADIAALRARVAEAGGIAPVVRGPGGLGDAPMPAREVHRRLKAAFDPAGILAPGRLWGGL
jgi:glycolate oxidase FAD binding subunit